MMGAGLNKASRKMSLSQAIRDYVKGLESIDFRDCPPAFTAVFARHKEAWKGLLPITALENSPDGEEFKRRLQTVGDTWAEVERP